MEPFATLLGAVAAAAVVSSLGNRIWDIINLYAERKKRDPIAERRQRIDRLLTSLRESADLLAELEQDIVRGEQRSDELQRRIAEQQALADLTAAQSEAINEVLAEVIGRSDRRGFWQEIVLGALFFLLGVGASMLVT